MLKILQLKKHSDSFSLIQYKNQQPKMKNHVLQSNRVIMGKTHFDNPMNSSNLGAYNFPYKIVIFWLRTLTFF